MKTRHFLPLAMGLCTLLWMGCGSGSPSTTDANPDANVADSSAPAALQVPMTTASDPTLEPAPPTYPSSLKQAVEKLERLVTERDASDLKAMLAPDVMVGFMDGDPDMFMEGWELLDADKVGDSEVWPILEKILAGGGAIVNEELNIYAFPQYYANWPMDYEVFDHVLINGKGVNVRATPSQNGDVVAQLSYEIVKSELQSSGDAVYETIGGERHPWIEVERLNDGLKGYVFGKYIATGLDYRLGMQEYADGWKITYLIGGD